MDIFETCRTINDYNGAGNHLLARDELIKLLDYHSRNKIPYSQLVNHLIRETGLYPYLHLDTSSWQDRYAYNAFRVDVGRKVETLHREQSSLLKRLLSGDNIAVSARTSFGKSFIIDAFIAIKKPSNVVIIVPTLALTDETRRRLYRKFSNEYKIITTSEVDLGEKNIFIFPQERAISYVDSLKSIDILIIDEFYKASVLFDKGRAPALLRAIMKLGGKAKQKYFLAPNISSIKDNAFTKDMAFQDMMDFHTVYLEKHELYKEIRGDEPKKSDALLSILRNSETKSLIYAGTYSQIEKVSNLLIANMSISSTPLLEYFIAWLTTNYDANWNLINLAKRRAGIHNGRLHRSLSQLQIRLFEEKEGFDKIISTSSIIEGVNTSAENVIVWRNRNGQSKLNDFTYRNIIGRGGRMFKHFVGQIYLLEAPPDEVATQLEIPIPDEILGEIEEGTYDAALTKNQVEKLISFKKEMSELLGPKQYATLLKSNVLQLSNSEVLRAVARDMKNNSAEWNGLAYLNSDDPQAWDRLLYKLISLEPGNWDTEYSKFVAFIKVLTGNWTKTIPQLLEELDEYDIDINTFFTLERGVTFKFSALANDANQLQKIILDNKYDISYFVSRLSHAFLPSVVFQLEEYGLPRMISKKLHSSGIIDFNSDQLTIHDVISSFVRIGKAEVFSRCSWDPFEKYILNYFYQGISLEKS